MNQIDELKKEIELLKELIRAKDELIAELREAKRYANPPNYFTYPYTIEVTW